MTNQTAMKLLDAAERFTQTRGFNAFSYKDLEKEVGIKTASIHYHFPTKNDLAFHMADRYVHSFMDHLEHINQNHDSGLERVTALAEAFVSVAKEGKFCLCLMLSTDCRSIPEKAQIRVADFFQETEKWLEQNVTLAQKDGDISPELKPKLLAAQFIALLEGGLLIAQARTNPRHLRTLYQQTMATWKT